MLQQYRPRTSNSLVEVNLVILASNTHLAIANLL
jgi:hypothetical protein